jgi:hypothetical protein
LNPFEFTLRPLELHLSLFEIITLRGAKKVNGDNPWTSKEFEIIYVAPRIKMKK